MPEARPLTASSLLGICTPSAQAKAFQQRAHRAIPAGCHTYNKGDDQYPVIAPPALVRGRGCRVWDVDDNEFIEYGMGSRAVTLGHAHPRVVELVSVDAEFFASLTEVARIREMIETGTSAERQRAVHAAARAGGADEAEALRAVVRHLIEEYHADL